MNKKETIKERNLYKNESAENNMVSRKKKFT